MHGTGPRSYFAQHPSLLKWINKCATCGFTGYKPEMPEDMMGAKNIMGFYKPLELNEAGICEDCFRATNALE